MSRPGGPGADRPDPGSTPAWLSRWGRSGWMITGAVVGAATMIVTLNALLPLLTPVIIALLFAVALQPAVEWLRRRGASPTLAALIGALLVPLVLVVLAGLVLHRMLHDAAKWPHVAAVAGQHLRSVLGADPLSTILSSTWWRGALFGIGSILAGGAVLVAQLALGVLVGAYLLFFIFRNGARFADMLDRRLPMEPGIPRKLLGSATLRLRRYLLGTTVVAAMDALVISLGAAILGLPLIGIIAVITFIAAYVPYLGAWVSAAFAVIVALGAGGSGTAAWMLAIVLVTQNVLEGLMRPYVFGRALDLHPTAILAVTVPGAILGGLIGVFLAPPLAAIVVSWRSTLRQAATRP